MPVTVIAGATFTVKVGATDFSAQIKDGSIARAVNVINEKTLGPNTTPVATDYEDTVTINGLHDNAAAGWYDVIWEAAEDLDAIAVEITDGARKWTGTLMPSNLSADFGAEASATSSATFTGRLTRAAVA